MKRMVIHLPKDLSISMLMDFYGELLTPKQRDALDLYYNQDFSLAEIAQHMDISRQVCGILSSAVKSSWRIWKTP